MTNLKEKAIFCFLIVIMDYFHTNWMLVRYINQIVGKLVYRLFISYELFNVLERNL